MEALLGEIPELGPLDAHNRELASNVHPVDWVNPEPAGQYNLVVLGAGAAGLVSAAGAAGLGARVAIVERKLMGGDCLNVGCVPSKALLRSARAIAMVREAATFGVAVPEGVRADFTAVMERVRQLRARISAGDSARRFKELGVDVFIGQGRFVGPDRVEVGEKILKFSRAVVATGGRPSRLPIPGLEETGYLTNESVFGLTEMPRRMAIIGAGPIGCEMAQAFARLGSEVTLIEVMHGILPREDPDASGIVHAALLRERIAVRCCARDLRVAPGSGAGGSGGGGGAGARVELESHGERLAVDVDRILVSGGRTPNVEGLGLDAAGVAFDKRGVQVDDRLRTTNPRVFAAGDICSKYQFTHAADAMARIVIQNALFHGRARASALTIPWCTYTDPEIAHVGLYEKEAQGQGIAVRTFVQPLAQVDRAVLDGETDGLVKVHVREGSDRILGATIVARHAGEMISEITLAMTMGAGLGALSRTIHPYPTQAESLRKVGDAYNRTRLTPLVKGLLTTWLGWSR